MGRRLPRKPRCCVKPSPDSPASIPLVRGLAEQHGGLRVFCGTPWPLAYQRPRKFCASAFPWAAALRRRRPARSPACAAVEGGGDVGQRDAATNSGSRSSVRQESWRVPTGESPVWVRGSARPVASVATWKATTTAKRTQQSCGVWGMSHEMVTTQGPRPVEDAEGNMCGAAMRGPVALPGSKATSRKKGTRRNLGDLMPCRAAFLAVPIRVGKARSRSR